jgi:hypothetical protein
MKIKQLVALGLMVVAGVANAALPTEATAAFTTLSTNVTDVLAATWPVFALSVGGFALFKLVKRGVGKL